MAYNRDITADDKVFFDTDRTLVYTVYAGDPTAAQIAAGTAVPLNVAGFTVAWVLRKTPTSAVPLIEKTNEGSPSDISITGVYNVSPLINTQRIEVILRDYDTYDPTGSPTVEVKAGNYHYALKRLDTDAEAILAWGRFRLLRAAAWEAD